MNILGIFKYNDVDCLRLDDEGIIMDYPVKVLFSNNYWANFKKDGWRISSYNPLEAKDKQGVLLADYPKLEPPYFVSPMSPEDEFAMASESVEADLIPEAQLKRDYVFESTNVIEFAEGLNSIKDKSIFLRYLASLSSMEDNLLSYCPMNYIVAPEARISISELIISDVDNVSEVASIFGNIWKRLEFKNWDRFYKLVEFLSKNAGLKIGPTLNEIEFLQAYLKWGLDGIKDECVSMKLIQQTWGSAASRPHEGDGSLWFRSDMGVAYKKTINGSMRYFVFCNGQEVDITDRMDFKGLNIKLNNSINSIPVVIDKLNNSDKEYIAVNCSVLNKFDMIQMMFRDEAGFSYEVNLTPYDVRICQLGGAELSYHKIFTIDSVGGRLPFSMKSAWTNHMYANLNLKLAKALNISRMTTKVPNCVSSMDIYKQLGMPVNACYSSLIRDIGDMSEDGAKACKEALEDWNVGNVRPEVLNTCGFVHNSDVDKFGSQVETLWRAINNSSATDILPDVTFDYYNDNPTNPEEFMIFIDERLSADESYTVSIKTKEGLNPSLDFDILDYICTMQMLQSACNIIIGNWRMGIELDATSTENRTFRLLSTLANVYLGEDVSYEQLSVFLNNDAKLQSLIDLSEEYKIKRNGFDGYIKDRAIASNKYYNNAWSWITITSIFRELSNLPDELQRDYAVQMIAIDNDGEGRKYRNNCTTIITSLIEEMEYLTDEQIENALLYAPEIAAKISGTLMTEKHKIDMDSIGEITKHFNFPIDDETEIEITLSGTNLGEFLLYEPVPTYATLYYLYNFYVDLGASWNCSFAITNATVTPWKIIPMASGIRSHSLSYNLMDEDVYEDFDWYDKDKHIVSLIDSRVKFADINEAWETTDAIDERDDWIVDDYTADLLNSVAIDKVEPVSKYYSRWTNALYSLAEDDNGNRVNRLVTIPLMSDIKYGGNTEIAEGEIPIENILKPYDAAEGGLMSYMQFHSKIITLTSVVNDSNKIGKKSFTIHQFEYNKTNITNKETDRLLNEGRIFNDKFIKVSGNSILIWNSTEDAVSGEVQPTIYDIDDVGIADLKTLESMDVLKPLNNESFVMQTVDKLYVIKM